MCALLASFQAEPKVLCETTQTNKYDNCKKKNKAMHTRQSHQVIPYQTVTQSAYALLQDVRTGTLDNIGIWPFRSSALSFPGA